MSDLLDPRTVRAPDFGSGEWLNAERPLTRDMLRGHVVLVDFWDYTCVNCIRTLPYVRAWHDRYEALGLTVVGVHAPEFPFARSRRQIEAAVDEFGLSYPILLDNEYTTWGRFANRAWPAKHLVDAEGYIRYQRRGEGYYQDTELAIQNLLSLRDAEVALPPLLEPLRAEDQPGAVCYLPTPELHAGYEYGALGNPEGYAPDTPMIYKLPLSSERQEGSFYAEGIWQAGAHHFAFAGQDGGRLTLPYQAVGVNAVLSPSGDPVEVMLDLKRDEETLVEVRQDGRPLTAETMGNDVVLRDDGASMVRVTRPRMYELVRNGAFAAHEVELTFHANGLALFAFTFTWCVAPGAAQGTKGTFTIH